MRRLVWLSSTISTRTPRATAAAGRRRRLDHPKVRVESKHAAASHLALDRDVPPIRATSCVQMVRPRPVPPYIRVLEPSAWLKGSKIRACFSGESRFRYRWS
jgi:hypothetical protein